MDVEPALKASRPANGGRGGRRFRPSPVLPHRLDDTAAARELAYWLEADWAFHFRFRIPAEGCEEPGRRQPWRYMVARPCHALVGLYLAERWAERQLAPAAGAAGDGGASWATPKRLVAAWGIGSGRGLYGAVCFLSTLGWPIETGYCTPGGVWTTERPKGFKGKQLSEEVGYRLAGPVEFEKAGGPWY
jgi:hypothetical protein